MDLKIGLKLKHNRTGTIWTITYTDSIMDHYVLQANGFSATYSILQIVHEFDAVSDSTKESKVSCVCGVHIIRDHKPMMHSTYCPLFQKAV